MTPYRYVILGGGLAAGYAAQEFASYGLHPGELAILSAEKTLPYERPPLSKDFLAGKKDTGDILINEPAFYDEHGIAVRLEEPVQRVDFQAKELHTDRDVITYEKLLIATGARPRLFELPGSELDNIFYLRQVEDARRIRQVSQAARRAVVIGGGFIGMEVTAVLQAKGVETTQLFPEKRVWQALFTPEMSAYFETYYRHRGVTILPEEGVDSFAGDGRVTAVIARSGATLETDMVVAGIGVAPNIELFRDSGLHLSGEGILVNRFLETNFPDVFAAGDVTRYRDLLYDRTQHVEHWDNAVAQGRHAARMMIGRRQPFRHVPYFFSDVFDLSYEYWGDTTDARLAVIRGDVDEGAFSTWWLGEDDRLLAAFVMNRPEEERELAPEWIEAGKELPPGWLEESSSLRMAEAS